MFHSGARAYVIKAQAAEYARMLFPSTKTDITPGHC